MTFISVLSLLGAVATAAPVPTIPPATPAPLSAPTVTAAPSSLPAATGPTPTATLAPAAAGTLAPASYGYRFVPGQPKVLKPGAPQIFAVYLNAEHLKSHGPILIRVETSANVVKMQSKSNGRGGEIPMAAPGIFVAQSVLPGLPVIASGISTDLLFIATTADGKSVTVRVPVELG